jgi:hypothetical protein
MSTVFLNVVRSISVIHALLMLCMWPLTLRGPINDRTWAYCGFLASSALQVGLHRPGFHREYGYGDLPAEQSQVRTATWMMCYQMNIWYVSTF